MANIRIYQGNFIDTPEPGKFRLREGNYALVEGSRLLEISPVIPQEYQSIRVRKMTDGFIIPAFYDLHVHAPQHMQMGVGLDLGLLDWLGNHTFPGETRFSEPSYARQVYPVFAEELRLKGSLRAVVYGTIHRESSVILARALAAAGLTGFVGKVNMDRNSPPGLQENGVESIRETEAFIGDLESVEGISPIITPRFAPSCSGELMRQLGQLSARTRTPVQSHLSETIPEAEWVAELFPESGHYTGVYDEAGLLSSGSLMAHGIYLQEEEIELILKRGSTLVHCPSANINLSSGIMPLARFMDRGVKLALGSDVGAGHTLSMSRVIVQAVQSSKLLKTLTPEQAERSISLSEAFYLATAANGAYLRSQDQDAGGVFNQGSTFDALHVDMKLHSAVELNHISQLERFLYYGDDRNIIGRVLSGEEI